MSCAIWRDRVEFVYDFLETKETFSSLNNPFFVGYTQGRVQPVASPWPLIKRVVGLLKLTALDEIQHSLTPGWLYGDMDNKLAVFFAPYILIGFALFVLFVLSLVTFLGWMDILTQAKIWYIASKVGQDGTRGELGRTTSLLCLLWVMRYAVETKLCKCGVTSGSVPQCWLFPCCMEWHVFLLQWQLYCPFCGENTCNKAAPSEGGNSKKPIFL